MLVSDLMNPSVVSCAPDENVAHAARLMAAYNVGSLPVCSPDGRLRGIVTDRDIVLRCIADGSDPGQMPVRELMTRAVASLSPGDDVSRAAEKMGGGQVRRMPVVQNGKVVGILSLCDIARSEAFGMEAAKAFGEISSNLKRK